MILLKAKKKKYSLLSQETIPDSVSPSLIIHFCKDCGIFMSYKHVFGPIQLALLFISPDSVQSGLQRDSGPCCSFISCPMHLERKRVDQFKIVEIFVLLLPLLLSPIPSAQICIHWSPTRGWDFPMALVLGHEAELFVALWKAPRHLLKIRWNRKMHSRVRLAPSKGKIFLRLLEKFRIYLCLCSYQYLFWYSSTCLFFSG